MNQEKRDKLVNDFPDIFRYYREDYKPASGHYFYNGIDVGDGWFDLIYTLARNVHILVASMVLPTNQRPAVVQVKQKFGGLRFYMDNLGGQVEINKLINEAEGQSFNICEDCGCRSEPSANRDGWVMSRCASCMEKHDREMEKYYDRKGTAT